MESPTDKTPFLLIDTHLLIWRSIPIRESLNHYQLSPTGIFLTAY